MSRSLHLGRGLLLGMVSSLAAATGIATGQMPCKAPPALKAHAEQTHDGSGYISLGAWYGDHHEFACAQQALRLALKQNPKSAPAEYLLGLSLYAAGQRAEALEPLRRSAALDTQALPPRLLLGTALDELGQRKEAETAWKAALALKPESPEALDGLAQDLMAEHDPMAAVQVLANAPMTETLVLDRVTAYGQANLLDDAAKTAKAALAEHPESLPLTRALVTVYVHQSRFQDAVDLLRGYLKVHPGDQQAEIQYLSALVLTNDTKEARPLAQKLLVAAPHNFDVLYLNGVLEREAEEFPAARTHLEAALAERPDDPTVNYNLGATLAHLDQPKAAQERLEKAIALDPNQPDAHFQLAAVLRAAGQTDAARQQISLYQQLKQQGTQQTLAESKAQQAKAKLAAGDTTAAVGLYQEAVAATPANAHLQFDLAMALDDAKRYPEEKAALEHAVQLDPTFALASNQLGYLHSREGQQAAAEAAFRRAVEAAPGFTEAWINLAATLASEGRMTEAKQAVGTALHLDPRNAQAAELNRQLAQATHS